MAKQSIHFKLKVLNAWLEDLKKKTKRPRKRVVELDDE
jgi:hypothetical protein